ncbi:MAG: S8 family serine peptidase [Verrucomicrobiota bacterium]
MAATLGLLPAMAATNTLTWDREKNLVSADVRDWDLIGLMESVATQSGWHVYLEPDYSYKASTKFQNLPPGEALRRLLGSLNFAMVPQTNGPQRLYVFRTVMKNATQQIRNAGERTAPKPRRVPNELIVRLKPGTDAEALAKSLGAKIVGVIPELNAYRFQFESEEATEAARLKLESNPSVASVEYNYYMDQPFTPQSVGGMAVPETKLTLDPPKTDDCKVLVGFVDTTLQQLDPKLEAFVKTRISVTGNTSTSTTPTHQTAMVNAFLQSLQASGQASTSARVLSVDVFGNDPSANSFNVALGIMKAVNGGATAINLSLGGYQDVAVLRDVVQQATALGIPLFAAVGNDGSNTPFYPAAYPGVVSVTALAKAGQIASYANTGTQADAAAPGAVIFSYNGLIYGSQGTSVSSAVATGIAAGLADSTCAPWSKVIPAVEKTLAVPASK